MKINLMAFVLASFAANAFGQQSDNVSHKMSNIGHQHYRRELNKQF